MVSALTNILGSVLAQVPQTNPSTQVKPETTGNVTQSQLAQASQAAAERSTAGVKARSEKDGGIQIPKRVEGAFVGHRVKPKKKEEEEETGAQDQEQDHPTHPGEQRKLNVKA